ncbi:hypothetical protein ACFVIN_32340 [Streptomyces prasinus]
MALLGVAAFWQVRRRG